MCNAFVNLIQAEIELIKISLMTNGSKTTKQITHFFAQTAFFIAKAWESGNGGGQSALAILPLSWFQKIAEV